MQWISMKQVVLGRYLELKDIFSSLGGTYNMRPIKDLIKVELHRIIE